MNRATANSCVIIPTYNNAGTVCDVAARAVAQGYPVIVVNDGSTDDTAARLAQSGLPLTVLTHPRNRGKGVALRTAFSHAREQGFRYAITLDADGQHYPEDIPVLVEAIAQHPGALVVGSRNLQAENMPGATASPTASPISGSGCRPPAPCPTPRRATGPTRWTGCRASGS